MNQNDLRVIKTEQNIQVVFIQLLQEKDFQKITVQDILSGAMINRTTFYKHYMDKYDLAERMCGQIYEILVTHVQLRFQSKNETEFLQSLQELYAKLLDRSQDILALFRIHTETIHLYDDMQQILKNVFQKERQAESAELTDYFATLYASSVMTTIKWCLENHKSFQELMEQTEFFSKLRQMIEE